MGCGKWSSMQLACWQERSIFSSVVKKRNIHLCPARFTALFFFFITCDCLDFWRLDVFYLHVGQLIHVLFISWQGLKKYYGSHVILISVQSINNTTNHSGNTNCLATPLYKSWIFFALLDFPYSSLMRHFTWIYIPPSYLKIVYLGIGRRGCYRTTVCFKATPFVTRNKRSNLKS